MTLLDERSPRKFYDGWEFLPEEKRRIIIRENLDSYVAFARDSLSYYRDRLTAYDPSGEYPLAEVPVLTAGELRDLLPPVANALVTGGARDYTVFQSGGTTGVPKTTLFSHAELERLNLPNARGFYACGLDEGDRVGNLFAVGGLYMTFIHINRMLQQYGCMNFPFSNHTPVDFIHTVVRLFDINCLTGIASVVMNALRGMKALGLDGIRIEKVFYGGEHLYEADKREIEDTFGAKVVLAPGYGTVDTWYLGYQCTACPTGVFHAHDDEAYMEIVNEDLMKHVVPGEPGMLYATALPRRAKWLREPCPCGRTTPLFRLLGRGDDVLRVGYDSIDYQAVQDAVLGIAGLTGTIQMEKRREEVKDRLILRIESNLAGEAAGAASLALDKAMLESRPSLRQFMEKGTVHPLRIELVPPGTLPRNPRTGKLMRVIDAAMES